MPTETFKKYAKCLFSPYIVAPSCFSVVMTLFGAIVYMLPDDDRSVLLVAVFEALWGLLGAPLFVLSLVFLVAIRPLMSGSTIGVLAFCGFPVGIAAALGALNVGHESLLFGPLVMFGLLGLFSGTLVILTPATETSAT